MAGYATPAWTNDASPAIDDSAMLDIGHGIELAEHPYGVCSTAAATAAKTVTIDYSGTLTIFTGLTVRVKFTDGNSAASPTLNVNNTGAKSIIYGTSFAAGGGWTAGAVTELTYDGTNWIMSRANAVDTNATLGSENLISSDAVAREIITVNFGTLTGTGGAVTVSKSDTAITANHVLLAWTLGTPAAQTGNITITTGPGVVSASGNINGSTTLTVVLGKQGKTIS